MNIILSCGHSVDTFSDSMMVYTKSECRDGTKAIKYSSVCDECYKALDMMGLILHDELSQESWIEADD